MAGGCFFITLNVAVSRRGSDRVGIGCGRGRGGDHRSYMEEVAGGQAARGHRRGTRRNKIRHQWRLSIRALGDRKGMGRRRASWQRRPGQWRLGRCPMKVTTSGSLTGWADLSARGRRRPNRTSGADDGPTGLDREGGGGPRLGWKIREEAGPKPFLGLKSNRVKENQF
jgi:hypothetical protein